MNSHEAGQRDVIIQSRSCKLSALGEWEMIESSVCVSVCRGVVYVCLIYACCKISFVFVFKQNENGN